ncbi:MAG: helix-turn-helix domain-containing protein [Lachnospiraceae bacterium]|nr:helix-turn-helix domain-containing protein [Lachnospiraceae bacterium]
MINILDKITYYKKLKGWSEYELAEYSGISQSTINSWFTKNINPSVASLDKICNAFNITLSQFFAEKNDPMELTEAQQELLEETSVFTEKQQRRLIEFLKSMHDYWM